MTANEYQKLAELTESKYFALHGWAAGTVTQEVRGLHAALGMATEAGEFVDLFKKAMFYNRGEPVDVLKVKEEVGDLLWYCALACNAYGLDMEVVMAGNIAKLKVRCPEGFSQERVQEEARDQE